MEYFEYSFKEKVNMHEYNIPNPDTLFRAVEEIMPENSKFKVNQSISSWETKGNKHAEIEMKINVEFGEKYNIKSNEIKKSLEKVLGHELTEKTI